MLSSSARRSDSTLQCGHAKAYSHTHTLGTQARANHWHCHCHFGVREKVYFALARRLFSCLVRRREFPGAHSTCKTGNPRATLAPQWSNWSISSIQAASFLLPVGEIFSIKISLVVPAKHRWLTRAFYQPRRLVFPLLRQSLLNLFIKLKLYTFLLRLGPSPHKKQKQKV